VICLLKPDACCLLPDANSFSIFVKIRTKINSMASIKQLKKDVDNQIFEVISDCLLFMGLHPENKTEEVSVIIEDAVELRNDLFARINDPELKDDHKAYKKHLGTVTTDLASGVEKLCERLSSVSKKKKK